MQAPARSINFGEEIGIASQLFTEVADVRRYTCVEVFRPTSLTRVATGPAVLGSEQCGGTDRATELAHHHIARARKHLAATGLTDTVELDAFAEAMMPTPLPFN